MRNDGGGRNEKKLELQSAWYRASGEAAALMRISRAGRMLMKIVAIRTIWK
jgi:hypothetical protein